MPPGEPSPPSSPFIVTLRCQACVEEHPDSPHQDAVTVGWTTAGLAVRCAIHDGENVVALDFMGQQVGARVGPLRAPPGGCRP